MWREAEMFESERRLAVLIILALAFLYLLGWLLSHTQISESGIKALREKYKSRHAAQSNSIDTNSRSTIK
jgi:hypothetical protein